MKPFRLTDNFLDKYKSIEPPFGFNGFGLVVYYRTYSRKKSDGYNEVWWETVKRVVEGCYNMQKRHIIDHHLGWDESKAQRSAQEMYHRIFNMKFLPPGRGLWAMGSSIIEERGISTALFNCAYISTEGIKNDPSEAFRFLMDMSMLGVGVGFDVKGENKILVKGYSDKIEKVTVPDTREGWVEVTGKLIENGILGGPDLDIDYSEIRPEGEEIKGFGGTSSGPGPLIKLHQDIRKILSKEAGKLISAKTIVDLQNSIGVCVVSGNVRRSAQIVFGNPYDENYLDLKNYVWNSNTNQYEGPSAERSDWGWASNNSVYADLGMDYSKIAERIKTNGEPGLIWMESVKKYGRLADTHEVVNPSDWKDSRASGSNPCSEQSLEDGELCCLCETFPTNHESLEDYIKTLKYAYLYAKTVTLGKTSWEKTNRIMLRNRRIGCSQSGIQQFIASHGIHEYKKWCEEGYKALKKYDEVYSEWFCIPKSIKISSIKPSGTVSCLSGSTPGMHWPEDLYYIRRMRLAENSDLVEPLKKAGYLIEPAYKQPGTVVVEFPIALDDLKGKLRPLSQVSVWEQVNMAAFIQKWWADNQVSCTVTFDPETEGNQIEKILNYFQYDLKSISFLPRIKEGAYTQMPYEAISKEEYDKRISTIKPLSLTNVKNEDVELEPGCESGACNINQV
jgi:ribonucleoside-triphosphate reductase (thioredoxin)